MRWKVFTGERPWHRWFAWYPVRIHDENYWLEYVLRKKENALGWIITQYRRTDEACICTDAELEMFGSPDPLCEAEFHKELK